MMMTASSKQLQLPGFGGVVVVSRLEVIHGHMDRLARWLDLPSPRMIRVVTDINRLRANETSWVDWDLACREQIVGRADLTVVVAEDRLGDGNDLWFNGRLAYVPNPRALARQQVSPAMADITDRIIRSFILSLKRELGVEV